MSPLFVGGHLVRVLKEIMHPSQYCDNKFENIYHLPVEISFIRHIYTQNITDSIPAAFHDE